MSENAVNLVAPNSFSAGVPPPPTYLAEFATLDPLIS